MDLLAFVNETKTCLDWYISTVDSASHEHKKYAENQSSIATLLLNLKDEDPDLGAVLMKLKCTLTESQQHVVDLNDRVLCEKDKLLHAAQQCKDSIASLLSLHRSITCVLGVYTVKNDRICTEAAQTVVGGWGLTQDPRPTPSLLVSAFDAEGCGYSCVEEAFVCSNGEAARNQGDRVCSNSESASDNGRDGRRDGRTKDHFSM